MFGIGHSRNPDFDVFVDHYLVIAATKHFDVSCEATPTAPAPGQLLLDHAAFLVFQNAALKDHRLCGVGGVNDFVFAYQLFCEVLFLESFLEFGI